jgi:hypothetical protein
MQYIEEFDIAVSEFLRGSAGSVHYSVDRVKNDDPSQITYAGETWVDKGPAADVKVPLKIIIDPKNRKATIVASSLAGELKATHIYSEKHKYRFTQSLLSRMINRMERKIPEIESYYEFVGNTKLQVNEGLRSCTISAVKGDSGCTMDYESDATDIDELILDGMTQLSECFDGDPDDFEFECIDYDGDL